MDAFLARLEAGSRLQKPRMNMNIPRLDFNLWVGVDAELTRLRGEASPALYSLPKTVTKICSSSERAEA